MDSLISDRLSDELCLPHQSVSFCTFQLVVQMLLSQHHYSRCICLLSKVLAQQQALPTLLPGHAGKGFHLEGMAPTVADGNVYQLQMLFDRRLHADHLTQVKAAMLPNSPVTQPSSPPSAQPSSVPLAEAVAHSSTMSASPGSVMHTTSPERATFKLYTIFYMYCFQNW